MFRRSLAVVEQLGSRTSYIAQRSRTLLHLSASEDALGLQDEAAQNKAKAGELMAQLSRDRHSVVVAENLDDLIPNWAG